MPLFRSLFKTAINTIIDSEVLDRIIYRLRACASKKVPSSEKLPKDTELTAEAQEKRLQVIGQKGARLDHLKGSEPIKDTEIFQGNIENYIGTTQIPTGVIGPLRVNGVYANGEFYVPMATTEATLVASYNRGAKTLTLAGGARVMCLTDCISRAPGFIFNDLIEASRFVAWCSEEFDHFKEIVTQTTRHGRLQEIQPTIEGNYVYINFQYVTGDATGQNMVTISTEAVCQYILDHAPVRPKQWFIESNMSGDKKATALSHLIGRGKNVTGEVVIPRKLVKRLLHTTPEDIVKYWTMSFVGGVKSGSIGVNGHFANALAAIFMATGQDVACVSEASIGNSRADLTEEGDLYATVSLPNLIVGTVGGGTGLPTQQECLSLMGCTGKGTARKFAEICAAVVLAGELSIAGAIAGGYFTQAHLKYARKKNNIAQESDSCENKCFV